MRSAVAVECRYSATKALECCSKHRYSASWTLAVGSLPQRVGLRRHALVPQQLVADNLLLIKSALQFPYQGIDTSFPTSSQPVSKEGVFLEHSFTIGNENRKDGLAPATQLRR